MGRPKKITTDDTTSPAVAGITFVADIGDDIKTDCVQSEVELEITESKVSKPPFVKRNTWGLFDHIKYTYKPNGFVDWRSMISSEHIVLNKENFLRKENPIDLDTLGEDEMEALKRKASEKDILIKLSGYKELAQLRGIRSLVTEVNYISESNFARAECKITWLPNYETNYYEVVTNGNADACPENTNGFSSKYLVAIAENRAIIRAIRSFLQIQIVGQDEVKSETPDDFRESGPVLLLSGPQGAIAKKLKDSKKTLAQLVQFAITKHSYGVSNPEFWNKVQDIPPADATYLLDKFGEFLNE